MSASSARRQAATIRAFRAAVRDAWATANADNLRASHVLYPEWDKRLRSRRVHTATLEEIRDTHWREWDAARQAAKGQTS